MASREKSARNAIRAELKRRGIFHMPIPASAYGMKGAPDMVACVNGNFVAIETKSGDGLVSPLQVIRHEAIRRSGGAVVVARSVDDLIGAIGSAHKKNPPHAS